MLLVLISWIMNNFSSYLGLQEPRCGGLTTTDPDFPISIWYCLLNQVVITLNLLSNSWVNTQPFTLCLYMWELLFQSMPHGNSSNQSSYPWESVPIHILGALCKNSLMHWIFALTIFLNKILNVYYRYRTLHWHTTIISSNLQITSYNCITLLETIIWWHPCYK